MVQDAHAADPPLAHIAEPLRHLAIPIDSLTLDPANARKHDAANLSSLCGSLKEFGQVKLIVVNRATRIVEAGNGTLMAARRLGWSPKAPALADYLESLR